MYKRQVEQNTPQAKIAYKGESEEYKKTNTELNLIYMTYYPQTVKKRVKVDEYDILTSKIKKYWILDAVAAFLLSQCLGLAQQ